MFTETIRLIWDRITVKISKHGALCLQKPQGLLGMGRRGRGVGGGGEWVWKNDSCIKMSSDESH